MAVRPFTLHVPEGKLAELRARLAGAQWPRLRPGSGWSMGTDEAFLHRVVAHWLRGFDWRSQEAALNQLPQFLTGIDGLQVHFVHARGRGRDPVPLLLAHGWPGTFAQMADLIPLLTAPGPVCFDVVVPSLPGFAFSDPFPAGGPRGRIADLWHRLMTGVLGYPRFAAAGGDIGSDVVTRLALQHPGALLGIHLTDVRDPWLGPGSAPLSPAEQAYRADQERWYATEGGYDLIQATKPATLAYALADSPLGACAWILEKLRAWSDCGGDLERRFTLDQLLTQVTLYLVTDCLPTSIQLYFDRVNHPQGFGPGDRVRVPTGVALFPAEKPANPPREWAERAYDLRRWTAMPRGGHFPALEEPALLAEDLRAFFGPLVSAGSLRPAGPPGR
jgi:pimeloyl-ACP methyl ester carboxylesterase